MRGRGTICSVANIQGYDVIQASSPMFILVNSYYACSNFWLLMAIFACLESPARPPVLDASIDKGYRAMGNDRKREAEASEWTNGLIADTANASR